MQRTGRAVNFRVAISPTAYNHKIPLFNGDANRGWTFVDNHAFSVFPSNPSPEVEVSPVIVTRVPLGHTEYDPGRETRVPVQEDVQQDVSDNRQIAWTPYGFVGGTEIADADVILVHDIYLSRVLDGTVETIEDDTAMCFLEMEEWELTDFESEQLSAKTVQLGLSSKLGKFSHQ